MNTASATTAAATSTLSMSSQSISLRHSAMRKRPLGSRIMHPVTPIAPTFSTMRHSKRGTRGVPLFRALKPLSTQVVTVPLRMEISSLRWRLCPTRIGDIGMSFMNAVRAKLARLEALLATIVAHRRTPKGTALVGSMAVKPTIELTEAEILRRSIAAEICSAGGFVAPRLRPIGVAAEVKVVRRRRASASRSGAGGGKVKIGWLDVVETQSVRA